LEREVIRFSASLFAVQALEYTFGSLDKIVLGYWLDARRVGIYVVAASVTVFVPILLQSVNQIFSPTIADLHARGRWMFCGGSTRLSPSGSLDSRFAGDCGCVFAAPLMQILAASFERMANSGNRILGQLINAVWVRRSFAHNVRPSGPSGRVQVKVVIANIVFNLFSYRFGNHWAMVVSRQPTVRSTCCTCVK